MLGLILVWGGDDGYSLLTKSEISATIWEAYVPRHHMAKWYKAGRGRTDKFSFSSSFSAFIINFTWLDYGSESSVSFTVGKFCL